MKRILVTGLCIGMLGCSSAKTNILVSRSQTIKAFGGVTEKYDPTVATVENEYEKMGGFAPLLSAFYGKYWKDYEVGFDAGLKYNAGNSYFRGRMGAGYESKKFERQSTRMNVHVKIGLGFERQLGENTLSFGAVFDHRSNGNSVLKNLGIDVNKEPNDGINTIGYEIGFSF